MELSLFLAKAWGIYLTFATIAMLANRKVIDKVLGELNTSIMFFSGAASLALGSVHIIGHNVWTPGYAWVVSLLGWIIFIRGLVRMFMPEWVVKVARGKSVGPWITPLTVLFLVGGVYLLWSSFA